VIIAPQTLLWRNRPIESVSMPKVLSDHFYRAVARLNVIWP